MNTQELKKIIEETHNDAELGTAIRQLYDRSKEELTKVYLAIPYTGMEEDSFTHATTATASILKSGKYNIFSPITHSHFLTGIAPEGDNGEVDLSLPGTWEFWKNIDYQFIDWADEVWVLVTDDDFDAILDSTGVQAEIKYAFNKGMKVRYVQINNLTFEVEPYGNHN